MANEPRTAAEITAQIEGLKKEKERLPEYSGMGTPNWRCVDAKISILNGEEDLDDFDEGDMENMDEDNEVYRAAEEADQWLQGDREEDLFEEE